MSQFFVNASTEIVPSNVATSYVTNSGTAIPVASILNVLGQSGTTTSGSGNTINITTSVPFNPNAVLQEFDDFLEPSSSNGKLQWSNISGNNASFGTNGTITNPGIISLTPSAPGNVIGLSLAQVNAPGGPSNISQIALGGGTISCNWIIQLSALSAGGNTYRFSCGMSDAISVNMPTDSFVDGVYFQYSDSINSGKWTINCTKSSVTTSANTLNIVGTTFVNLGITVNAAGTSAAFFLNGVQVANSPITTNIPSSAMTPFFMAINTAGTTPQINADLFYIQYILTTPR